MMRWRILSALIGWPAVGVALVYLPERAFGLLAAAAIIVALFEYLRLLVFPRSRLTGWLALVTGVVQILPFLINSLPSTLIILITASLILFAVSVIARSSLAENLMASAFAVAGLVYVVIPLGFMILIRYLPRGIYLLGFLFLVTWARDLGAFLTGRTIGSQNSHVISASISPRKTHEGAVGGVVASTIVALLTRNWLGHEIPLPYVLLLGMTIGIIGQVGDLVESLMKRVSKVADSSTLIPGQGGLLDTLDSFIYTAPLLYFLSQW